MFFHTYVTCNFPMTHFQYALSDKCVISCTYSRLKELHLRIPFEYFKPLYYQSFKDFEKTSVISYWLRWQKTNLMTQSYILCHVRSVRLWVHYKPCMTWHKIQYNTCPEVCSSRCKESFMWLDRWQRGSAGRWFAFCDL